MKKTISFVLIIITLFYVATPAAYAKNNEVVEWQDIYLSQEELDEMLEVKYVNYRASGLIVSYSLNIKKSGSNLIIAGFTFCTTEVVKSGYKELVIQRRADSTQSWTDYVTYEDLYDDSPSYVLSKSIAVGTGYQYRVTAIHYAKKNIFSTEKISNTSNTVVFA